MSGKQARRARRQAKNKRGADVPAGADRGITSMFPIPDPNAEVTEFALIDARANGNRVQFVAGPVNPSGDDASPIIAMLSVKVAADLAAAIEERREGWEIQGGGRYIGLAYLPDEDGYRMLDAAEEDTPMIARGEEPPGGVRWFEAPAQAFDAVAQALRDRIIPDAEASTITETTLMEFHGCSVCGRPVFETAPTAMVATNGVLVTACELCVSGTYLDACRSLVEAGLPPARKDLVRSLKEIEAALRG